MNKRDMGNELALVKLKYQQDQLEIAEFKLAGIIKHLRKIDVEDVFIGVMFEDVAMDLFEGQYDFDLPNT